MFINLSEKCTKIGPILHRGHGKYEISLKECEKIGKIGEKIKKKIGLSEYQSLIEILFHFSEKQSVPGRNIA